MEKVTFVISTYEDIATTIDTINSLLATTQGHEKSVIVIDDGNTILHELDIFPEVVLYRNEKRIGVGGSLDRGIKLAETEIVVPMGNDIRFSGDWLPRFYDTAIKNPKSIISSVCAGLNLDRQQLTGKENHLHAAHILFHVTTSNNNRVLEFREYLEAKWNPKQTGDVVQVGCILGAIYICHKKWFEKIGGFTGHRTWGDLEPILSCRSYINGGDCLLDLGTVTGHIFRTASSHKPIRDLIYNKLLMAYTLLPSYMEEEVYRWAKGIKHSEMSFIFLEQDKELLKPFRELKESLGDEKIKELLMPTGLFS